MLELLVIVTALAAMALYALKSAVEEVRDLERDISWYKHWFRTRIGSTCGYGDYYIASFDCGRTWWNVEPTEDAAIEDKYGRHIGRFGYRIIDQAETSLLDELAMWEDIREEFS